MRLTMRETLLAFRRSPLLSALSILTIAFSLFAFGLFGLVALNVHQALQKVEERVEIRAFIVDGTPVETISSIMGDVGAFPEVARVELVTPEQALEKARAELGEFKDVYDAAFLPASVEVRMKEGHRDPATVKAVADRIASYPVIDDVRYGEEWVVQLYRIQNIAAATGIILGASCAAVAIIIIGATIRMSVLARSREISIMRLVGATDGFIRRPFLVEHFLKGIAGGVAALLFTYLAHEAIARSLHIQTTFFDQRLALAGIAAGGLIGLFGSVVSVGRQLRRV